MPLSDTQVGRAGEQLFAAIASLTSDGELEFYRPETDDDHRDLEAGRKRHMGAAYVQVKSRTAIETTWLVPSPDFNRLPSTPRPGRGRCS